MKLNSLKPIKGSVKNKKRVGRGHGSGAGKSAGRGNKGAGQRSGFKEGPGLREVRCRSQEDFQKEGLLIF